MNNYFIEFYLDQCLCWSMDMRGDNAMDAIDKIIASGIACLTSGQVYTVLASTQMATYKIEVIGI